MPEVEGAQSFATSTMQKNIPELLRKLKCFVLSSIGSPLLAYIENPAEKQNQAAGQKLWT